MNDDGGVAAVERALTILDALTDEKTTLAELAKRTDLYKSTLLRLIVSLEKFGYVLRDADGCYRLGSKVLHLGSLYQKHFRVSEVVVPVLRKLVEELREGASFYIADADWRVVLHRIEASRAVRDAVREGDRFPLTSGASGHVLCAFNGTSGKRFDEVRQQMYASSFGERDPETAAFAVPVFARGNHLVGALNISGPRYRIEALKTEEILPPLFKYARELTAAFGGDPADPAFAGWNLPLGRTKQKKSSAK